MSYFIFAYGAVWILLLLYLVSISRQQHNLEIQLKMLIEDETDT